MSVAVAPLSQLPACTRLLGMPQHVTRNLDGLKPHKGILPQPWRQKPEVRVPLTLWGSRGPGASDAVGEDLLPSPGLWCFADLRRDLVIPPWSSILQSPPSSSHGTLSCALCAVHTARLLPRAGSPLAPALPATVSSSFPGPQPMTHFVHHSHGWAVSPYVKFTSLADIWARGHCPRSPELPCSF